jgi:LmbE family N-acetylglucosaminyl deacetylase
MTPRHNPRVRSIAADPAVWPDAFASQTAVEDEPVKALLINAHPDDESESAAVVYRITHEAGGIVDQVVITNGEGGHRYAAVAESYYGLPLTSSSGRQKLLAQIRREELLRASRILGIRRNYFLDQPDTGLTLNIADALEAWDIGHIQRELWNLLDYGKYNAVLVLLPTPDTHGHHQTVAALTLETVARLDEKVRPAVLGVRTALSDSPDPAEFSGLPGYPLTRTVAKAPLWGFDRRSSMTCHPALDYSIVVNWVIAEHKSQGFFQMEYGRRTREYFWLFEAGGKVGLGTARVFQRAIGASATQQHCLAGTPKDEIGQRGLTGCV